MMMSTCDLSGTPKSNSSYRKLKGCSSLWSIYMNFVLHLTLLVITLVTSAPVRHSTTIAEHYLLKFGYLALSENGPGEIRDRVSEAAVSDAILRLQRFGHLKETGVVDAATLRLMNKPRCGVPDEPNGQFRGRQKRFAIQGQKWETTNLTWSLKSSTHRSSLSYRDVYDELEAALDVWTKDTKLSFKPGGLNADIQIEFSRLNHGDGYSFDGIGLVLAHAFFPGKNQGGDAHFDDDEEWISSTQEASGKRGTVLFSVAAHEFGHSLGLSHSDVQGALMYPWYQTFTRDHKLHSDDVNGIQQLYGYKRGMDPNPFPYAPRRPAQPQGPKAPKYRPRPSACDSSYDAISLIRGELFIFKGMYYWRFNELGSADKVPPAKITEMWKLPHPHNLTHIDAVYERNGRDIIFFIGKHYYVFDGTTLKHSGPLTELGFKPDVEKIDGALVWGHNGKTYLFSGSQYWRLDDTQERNFKVEPDYPRDMYVWKGVPYDIDAVFRYKDHKTYFFKGKVFWTFDDKRMKVVSETPAFSGPYWMGCTTGALPPNTPALDSPNSSKAFSISPSPVFTLAMIIYVFFL